MKGGSCLCGGVTFEVGTFVPHTTNCFCSMCRKFHGAAYATFGVVRLADFQVLSGHDLLTRFTADNGTIRTFCANCGSSLFYQGNAADSTIDVALGVMDDEPGVIAEANIYMADKPRWVELSPQLPAYEGAHDLP